MGIFGFVGGGAMILRASFEAIRLIWRQRQWKRFQALGEKPRADPLATSEALRQRGWSE